MKYDTKTILIIVFAAISIFFGYKWYFSGDSESKDEVEKLEKEFKILKDEKDKELKNAAQWHSKYDSIQKTESGLQSEIDKAKSTSYQAELKANQSEIELRETRKRMQELRKQIDAFKANPPQKDNDLLLESIKNKTK